MTYFTEHFCMRFSTIDVLINVCLFSPKNISTEENEYWLPETFAEQLTSGFFNSFVLLFLISIRFAKFCYRKTDKEKVCHLEPEIYEFV